MAIWQQHRGPATLLQSADSWPIIVCSQLTRVVAMQRQSADAWLRYHSPRGKQSIIKCFNQLACGRGHDCRQSADLWWPCSQSADFNIQLSRGQSMLNRGHIVAICRPLITCSQVTLDYACSIISSLLAIKCCNFPAIHLCIYLWLNQYVMSIFTYEDMVRSNLWGLTLCCSLTK